MEAPRSAKRLAAKSLRERETQQRLIQVASRVFAERGYEGTRVRDIIEAADLNVASVNYYFGGKDGLYRATVEALAEARRARIANPEAEAEPQRQLQAAVAALLHRMFESEEESLLSRIITHELINPTDYFDEMIGTILGPEIERLRRILTRLCAPHCSEDEIRSLALGLIGQCFFFLCGRNAISRLYPGFLDPGGRDALARRVTAFALAATTALSAKAATKNH